MDNELLRVDGAPMGASPASALMTLLSLTSDGVLVFDGEGTIMLANDVATDLFRALPGGLVGSDVRLLFAPAANADGAHAPLWESLPFPLDGTPKAMMCESASGVRTPMRIRCKELKAPDQSKTTFVLTASSFEATVDDQDRREQLVSELTRANSRLSGTLSIVLSTLDSLDIATLFSRILDEITKTMDAWGTLAYMAEEDGYRLRGLTSALEDAPVPLLVENDHVMVEWTARTGHTVCMHALRPSRDDLRGGAHHSQQVLVEDVGVTVSVPANRMPPFVTCEAVPVWFDGRMIALVVVGWRNSYMVHEDDAKLLDSVAQYLSVQLAGALATLRAQHEERLDSVGTSLRERLLAAGEVSHSLVEEVMTIAAAELNTTLVPVQGNMHQKTTIARIDSSTYLSPPFDVRAVAGVGESVSPLSGIPGAESWLLALGQPERGVLVCVGEVDDTFLAFMFLHGEELVLERVDFAFLEHLVADIHDIGVGIQVRMRDKRIADALQGGMRNELQHVQGLSAEGLYSSATEAALVGGDFYDLISLPDHRACVILGDVSGKGVEAASVSSAVKTALGAYAWEGLTPARMMRSLNDFLMGFSRIETFATIFVGIVDVKDGTLTYCSAGHPPALLARADTGEIEWLSVQSGVVGAFASMSYQNGEISMSDGDILVLYTDGVTEARSPDGAFFGEDGLREIVSRESSTGLEGLTDRLLSRLKTFAGGSLDDDVALVALRYEGLGSDE